MRLFYFLLLPLVAMAAEPAVDTVSSQAVGAQAKTDNPELSKAKEERGQRNQALAKLRAGKPEETESLLGALSPATKDSPAWHLEMAMNLIRMAYDARSVGDDVAAIKVAQRAVKFLEKAERGYKEQPTRLSGMQEVRGVLQEQFLGTTDQAEVHFREALRLDPANESAKERVARLDRDRNIAAGLAVPFVTEPSDNQ